MTPPRDAPTGSSPARPVKRRRRRFSLNGLAIQLSAFALSFTLVALLVVSGSQAAFVEQNESVLEYVPIGAAAPSEGPRRPTGRTPQPPAEAPAELPRPVEAPASEIQEEPATEIELTDSDAGTAMFGNETLAPGTDADRCIEVTYAGDAEPGPVLLYAAATSGDLAPYLDLSIDLGRAEAGSFGGCGGFFRTTTVYDGTLADFAATHSSHASGRTTWQPSDEERSRSFRFRVSIRDVPDAMGKTASFGFSWRTEAA
jgi:hypothetical protein